MKTFLTTIAGLLMLAGVVSCGEDNDNCSCGESNTPIALAGTRWKLAGIVDVKTCKLRELEPKDCETCYTLEFNTDSTATGKSVANITRLYLLPEPLMGIATMVYDEEVGNVRLYYDAMKTISSCVGTKSELKLCDNERNNYLLFTRRDSLGFDFSPWALSFQ